MDFVLVEFYFNRNENMLLWVDCGLHPKSSLATNLVLSVVVWR